MVASTSRELYSFIKLFSCYTRMFKCDTVLCCVVLFKTTCVQAVQHDSRCVLTTHLVYCVQS